MFSRLVLSVRALAGDTTVSFEVSVEAVVRLGSADAVRAGFAVGLPSREVGGGEIATGETGSEWRLFLTIALITASPTRTSANTPRNPPTIAPAPLERERFGCHCGGG